jgi:hypothetical protein
MNGLFRNVMSLASGTTLAGTARLTNFNPDKILFYVDGGSSAITKAELAKINVTMNFKNSVGSGIAICANLPLDIVADNNDYFNGWGLLASETKGAFVLDIGKYCLRADDEITFDISTSTTLTNALAVIVKAIDSKISKEQLISYKYISASASQAYQQADVMSVFAKITSPSDSVYITTDDFFGSNNVSEIAVVAVGGAMGSAEDMDNYGPVWTDDTGLTQSVTVRAGSNNERFLIKCWNFDVNRIGFERAEFNSARNLAKAIADGNPSKNKCLRYFYGK